MDRSEFQDADLDDVIGLLNEASETPKHYIPIPPKVIKKSPEQFPPNMLVMQEPSQPSPEKVTTEDH